MARILLFNKPYMVLTQFTDKDNRATLANYLTEPEFKGFYPAGRLDQDSEGLLLLTDNGALQSRISHPKHKLPKTYWVQVEGEVTESALNALRSGVELKDGRTLPARVKAIGSPQNLWQRNPPIRERQNTPVSWLAITITEGRNRQVRRMTASVGLPTLRLIRAQVGSWQLDTLKPGEFRWENVHLPQPSKSGKRSTPRPKPNHIK